MRSMGRKAMLRDPGKAGNNQGAVGISFSFYFEKGALDCKGVGVGSCWLLGPGNGEEDK